MCHPYIESATTLSDMYVYMFVTKKNTFSDQLTFSNIRCRTSRRIYALPLLSPETLSSLSKLRIFLCTP